MCTKTTTVSEHEIVFLLNINMVICVGQQQRERRII